MFSGQAAPLNLSWTKGQSFSLSFLVVVCPGGLGGSAWHWTLPLLLRPPSFLVGLLQLLPLQCHGRHPKGNQKGSRPCQRLLLDPGSCCSSIAKRRVRIIKGSPTLPGANPVRANGYQNNHEYLRFLRSSSGHCEIDQSSPTFGLFVAFVIVCKTVCRHRACHRQNFTDSPQ